LQRASSRRWTSIERRWGVLFQQGALFSNLTVKENVAAPLFEHSGLSRKEIYELAELKIALVGLGPEALARKPAELSGGMRKRAGLARALALQQNLRLTVLMITHDLDTLYTITDRVAVLADRKVVATAPVEELEKSTHPWIQEYFLGPRGRAAAKHRPALTDT
jgi:phospholipid/cholesterol/gamma-HCH transport system ATP-binding protein